MVLALAAGCTKGDGDTQETGAGTGTSLTTTAAATGSTGVPGVTTTTTIPLAAYRTFGAPRPVSTTGRVVGTSLDGSAVWVVRPDPARLVPDCAGQRPADTLYRVSLTGGPDEVVRAGSEPITGEIVRGPGGVVAVFKFWASDNCPGSDATIYVGTETADGRLRDLRLVTGPDLQTLSSVDWTVDGKNLLIYRSGSKRRGDPWPVFRLDPTTGTTTKLFDVAGPLTAVRQLADGTYLFDHGDPVTINDASGAVLATAEGFLWSMSPDRKVAVVANPNATGSTPPVLTLTVGQSTPSTLTSIEAGKRVAGAVYSPDGRAVVYNLLTTGAAPTGSAVLMTLADKQTAAVPGATGVGAFTGDGRALVVYGRNPQGPLAVVPLGA